MSLISLCHMNRPMAFSLRSHVTLIRLRNINKAVKIKSQTGPLILLSTSMTKLTNPIEMSQLFAKCLTSLSKGIQRSIRNQRINNSSHQYLVSKVCNNFIFTQLHTLSPTYCALDIWIQCATPDHHYLSCKVLKTVQISKASTSFALPYTKKRQSISKKVLPCLFFPAFLFTNF